MKRALLLTAAASLAATPALAQSTLITFEALPGVDGVLGTADDLPLVAPADFGTQTEQLTDQFATTGIVFEPSPMPTENINEVLDATAVTQNILFSAPNALVSLGFSPITFRFTIPVTEVSALVGLGNGTDAMVAFDDQGTMIGPVLGNADVVTIAVDFPRVIERVEIVSAVIATPTIDNLTFRFNPAPIGTNYCTAAPNSSGNVGVIRASGSVIVFQQDLFLSVSGLPNNQFGIFLVAPQQDFVPGSAFGSDGNLCLGGPIGRFNLPNQIQGSGSAGQFNLTVDTQAIPTPTAFVPILQGQTWNFQAWFRDATPAGSNFSDGVQVTFM